LRARLINGDDVAGECQQDAQRFVAARAASALLTHPIKVGASKPWCDGHVQAERDSDPIARKLTRADANRPDKGLVRWL